RTVSRLRLLVFKRLPEARAHDAPEHDAADHEKHERPSPQRPSGLIHPRPIQHEITISRGEKILDLVVRLTVADKAANFTAQVRGDGRIRIGNGFVQTLRTA